MNEDYIERVWEEAKLLYLKEDEKLLPTLITLAYSDGVDAEREKVAKWMIERGYATGHGDTIEDLLKELEWQVAEREREACAKLCEEIKCGMWEESKKHRDTRLRDASDGAGVCIYAIRAREEK